MKKWKLNLKLINIQQNASSYSGNIWKVVIIIIIVTVVIEVILKMLVMYMDKDNNKEQYF